MHIYLVIFHVATMIASMALMSGAVGLGMWGKTSAVMSAKLGMYATAGGFVSGAILLLGAPLSLQCAELTAYVLGASALYYFGYGAGDVAKARFVRQTANS